MYTSPNDAIGLTIGVKREAWTDLSPELAGFVAPPIVVTARPLERPVNSRRRAQLSRSRGKTPVGGRRRTAG
ncbi:hypothetical protein Areg01_38420 [Actinoplanes regularis]|nr:hypothetical protein Areg01_38420 [Actinoplanes regularis]